MRGFGRHFQMKQCNSLCSYFLTDRKYVGDCGATTVAMTPWWTGDDYVLGRAAFAYAKARARRCSLTIESDLCATASASLSRWRRGHGPCPCVNGALRTPTRNWGRLRVAGLGQERAPDMSEFSAYLRIFADICGFWKKRRKNPGHCGHALSLRVTIDFFKVL